MHGDLKTSDNGDYNNSPHTTTYRNKVEQPQQTLPQNAAKTTPVERPLDPKKRKWLPWWPSGNIIEWIEDAKKARPLPHTEIILNNVQRKRKRWQMKNAKAEPRHMRHKEHETANYTTHHRTATSRKNPHDTHKGMRTFRHTTQSAT